jgi:hypothetical protein
MIYMIQDVTNNDTFGPEILEHHSLKNKASRHVYSSAFTMGKKTNLQRTLI